MEEHLNPYAAPKAEVTVATQRPPRPRVVKWATFVLGLFTVVVIYLYAATISARGLASTFKHQSVFDLPIPVTMAFLLCLFRRKDKLSFGVVIFTLGWICARTVERMWPRWTTPQAFENFWIPERIGEILFTIGVLYLFYRFTFGLPSRTYFGVVNQGDDQQRREDG